LVVGTHKRDRPVIDIQCIIRCGEAGKLPTPPGVGDSVSAISATVICACPVADTSASAMAKARRCRVSDIPCVALSPLPLPEERSLTPLTGNPVQATHCAAFPGHRIFARHTPIVGARGTTHCLTMLRIDGDRPRIYIAASQPQLGYDAAGIGAFPASAAVMLMLFCFCNCSDYSPLSRSYG